MTEIRRHSVHNIDEIRKRTASEHRNSENPPLVLLLLMGTEFDQEQNRHEVPLLLQLRGQLYDVAKFAKKHPGGEKVLRKLAGGDVDAFMRGEQRILGVKHEHSAAAYAMLERYNVEHLQKNDPYLDEKRGVLGRIGNLGADYWTWIHQPYEGTIRLFDSDFLERLTRTAWWVVPLVWMPLVVLFSALGITELHQNHGAFVASVVWGVLFSIGVLTWTLVEYLLHRYVFHWHPDTSSQTQIVLHFLIHGLHHKTPMDGDRLVFPPTPALFIIIFFASIYVSILPWAAFCCFGAGKLCGYVMYDCTHYYLHHGSPKPGSDMHYKKVYHHNHHFKNYDLLGFRRKYGIMYLRRDELHRLFGQMLLRYFLNEKGERVYTLKKTSPEGAQTHSAHPAKFSPEDKYSQYRVIVKKRFHLLPSQQAKIVY
ncbi:unnamed protein product, partial [Mesorhabditis spiculigera]